MQRVRLTLDFVGLDVPETYERATAADDLAVDVVNWNVAERPAAFLLRVRGDHDRFESILREAPEIETYDLVPETDHTALCFLAANGSAGTHALFAHFSRGSLLTVPPVQWNGDGTTTFTLFGTRDDIQSAVEDAPDGVAVTIDEIGGDRVAPRAVVHRLSERQRAAAEAAIDLGYYDEPRDATTADIARELDCSPSTAATHLRKAESKLLCALLDPDGDT